MASLAFNGIVANPDASFPPSLNLNTQNNGVSANIFGSNTKAVLFNKESVTTGYNNLNIVIDGALTSITVADSYNNKNIAVVMDDDTSYIFTLNTSTPTQTVSSFNSFDSVSTEKLRRWNLGYGGDGVGDPSALNITPSYLYATTNNVVYNVFDLEVPNYIIASTTVTQFSAYIENHILGFKNNLNVDFINCNMELIVGEGLSASKIIIPVTESAIISSNSDNLYTLYYLNTGSAILGVAKSEVYVPVVEASQLPEKNDAVDLNYLTQDNQTVTLDFNNAAATAVLQSYSSSISSFNTTLNSIPVRVEIENPSNFFGKSYIIVQNERFLLKQQSSNYILIGNKEYVFRVAPDPLSPGAGWVLSVLDEEQELLNLVSFTIEKNNSIPKLKITVDNIRKTGIVGDCLYIGSALGCSFDTTCVNGGCQDDGIAGGACECPCMCKVTTYPSGLQTCACECSLSTLLKCIF